MTGPHPPRRVLVVDDQDESRGALERILQRLGYGTEAARDGREALAKVQLDVDLILLDADMPGVDGFTVARRIREDPRYLDLPIIMVTGQDSKSDRLHAVEAGIDDFLGKPIEIADLRVRIARLLELKAVHDELARHRAELEQTVERRTAALRRALEDTAEAQRRTHEAHLDTIRRLVVAAEYKDRDTAAHIERIGRFCEVIARGLRLPPGEVEILRYASLMHDVGKLGIPDAILLKPGKLDPPEWEVMKRHTLIGARILDGSRSELLQAGQRIALTHHERWDGSGYPHGLAGGAIPLAGRICAVADVFDALTSDRHYRDAIPNAVVCEMMEAQRGQHFDPAVLDVFFTCREEIEAVQHRYARAVSGTAAVAAAGRAVLLVDDDAAVRRVWVKALERDGFTTTEVDNGLAAFAAVQAQEFGAVVCDVQMPFLEGRSFYQELAGCFPSLADRVVFVTGLADDGEVRRSLEATGRPVLKKPAKLGDLLEAVRRIAGGDRQPMEE